VIRGREPVVVDTGTRANRMHWLADVFSLVEPRDVKWIYLSHDDSDHTGNLAEVLEACPNATLVTNWFMCERMIADFHIPLERCRWVDDGQTIDVGDRVLATVTPPTYDSPTTRGLFDMSTGMYWASDSFAMPVAHAVDSASELPDGAFSEGLSLFQRALSPWILELDAAKWSKRIERVQRLDAKVIAGAHGPLLHGARIAQAFAELAKIPSHGVAALPNQAVLDQMLAAMHGKAA
jgi:flavorubredoxin